MDLIVSGPEFSYLICLYCILLYIISCGFIAFFFYCRSMKFENRTGEKGYIFSAMFHTSGDMLTSILSLFFFFFFFLNEPE